MWVPFAIIMEVCDHSSFLYALLIFPQFLKESSSTPETSVPSRRPSHSRVLSFPTPYRPVNGERQPLIRRRSLDQYDAIPEGMDSPPPTAGGTVLGIHNLAIVMPQFIVSLSYPPSICS
jgi:solute carrier family 45 protein 1/2/4